ncbi:MAG: hypothetical protein COT61_00470 [Candidatus Portnoybacteria bacterium CG09_land_8_20_14_0_10_44_13]|uniref:CYTH domain-containing protein n=4 Tax=Candidatus Portnoyibacteriota TaxID=1817913 RepID=A0A2H0WWN4_9BACT|nr:MAG: hypothetical protein COT61_00470 [Candidatus Portnoybacteria bacterium CG09_land_8_20_14_0_10_44_13]PIZ70153.1 MAG: hypothetical protein COY11_03095 [Candidatus Portnoybacteria bacterium CG_4_10_14_0_2_um_filter_44_20]PJA62755.1 MAG: hypothetical protein CO161_04770 [Candidatus Portnoybacteria bacterium CG_4_9_14_3_um_filter_44_9]
MAIPKIVITGGPCAGKSTGMATLVERLSDYGFRVFVVPEVPTFLFASGLTPGKMKNATQLYLLEKMIVATQIYLEKSIEKTAAEIYPRDKKIILCDRGVMDHRAYFPSEEHWIQLLKEQKYNFVNLRDCYVSVVHLVTAALGAEKFYTLGNNPARTETLAQAVAIDRKTRECWLGHPHFKIIDNSTDFDGKIRRVLSAVCKALDILAPTEIERKFLVASIDFNRMPPYQKIHIEQIYLKSDNPAKELRIRKRGQDGSFLYFFTEKWETDDPRERGEKERIIGLRQFLEMQSQRDPDKTTIKKDRICFLWKDQYFELDIYKSPGLSGLIILEIELTEKSEDVMLPPFITIEKEVTGDKRYYNNNLAKK